MRKKVLIKAIGLVVICACAGCSEGVDSPGGQGVKDGSSNADFGGHDFGDHDTSIRDSGIEPSEDAGFDANSMDAGVDGGSDNPPTPRAPCEQERCWLNAPALRGACGTTTKHENFETGRYNVHRYPFAAPGGVSVDLTLDATGGAWNPALLVLAVDGTTLYDGEHALTGGAVEIEGLASGMGGSSAKVRIIARADTPLHVFVTSWSVIDGGFAPPMPLDATYTLIVFADCPPPIATCPMDPDSITTFGSGYFTEADSDDPNAPNYSPYKRDSRNKHSGYDLHAPLDTPVVATQSGAIVSSETADVGDCGLSVNLAVDSEVTFRYCHLNSVLVTSGDVQAGQVIGACGKTGNAKAPHVHFVYLDAPNVTGSGTSAQKSEKVNEYIDNLCR